MSVELKIKSKHLSEEAKIIRFEEKKELKKARYLKSKGANPPLFQKYQELNFHRKWDVRNENRATFLARAFIQGTPYKSVEPNCKDKHRRDHWILPRVASMVAKYGRNVLTPEDYEWKGRQGYRPTSRLIGRLKAWFDKP